MAQVRSGWVITRRYQILKVVGSGGFATVYLAHDQLQGRVVAVKVLREEHAQQAGLVHRFHTEMRKAQKLEHPNILRYLAEGMDRGYHYLVMEFLEGKTLDAVIAQRGRFSLPEALSVTFQIASALSAAERAGIVHRDLKPGNVMMLPDGSVKVMDFGISKDLWDTGTAPSTIIFTPRYASPEQLLAQTRTDTRTDIYSLGVILYEMLSGRCPFGQFSPVALYQQKTAGSYSSLATLRPDLPGWVHQLVQKMMAPSPDGRFQHAKEVVDALSGVRPPRPPSIVKKKPLRPRLGNRRVSIALASVAFALVVLAIVLVISLTGPPVSFVEVKIQADRSCTISIEDAAQPETNTTFVQGPENSKLVRVFLNRATYTAIPQDDYSAIVEGTFREETLTISFPRYTAQDVRITIQSKGPDGKPLSLAGKSLFLQNEKGDKVEFPIGSQGDVASGGLDAGAWRFAGIGQGGQMSVTPSAYTILFDGKQSDIKESALEVSRPQPGEPTTRFGDLTVTAKQGRLSVSCDVGPAPIAVSGTKADGSPVAEFPYQEPVDLDPGSYRIRAEASGYVPLEQETTIAAAQESLLQFNLVPPQGDSPTPSQQDELQRLQAELNVLTAEKAALEEELMKLRDEQNLSSTDYARIDEIMQMERLIQEQIAALTDRIHRIIE